MKVTFPHMGNIRIPLAALLEALKLEIVPPPPITKKTLELGVKYSPEFACMPLKINLGNYIEALDQGADTILMAGGWGPCRFGYYAQVERDILQDLGYQFDMVILEAPDFRVTEIFQQLRALGQNVTFWEALQAVRYAWYKLHAVEKLENKFASIHPRVKDKQKAEDIYDQGLLALEKASSRSEIDRVVTQSLSASDQLAMHGEKIVKIGLVGEIYTVLEPAANYDMIRILGRLNVEVANSIHISEWMNDHLFGGLLKKSRHKQTVQCARPYLNHFVGGHGVETVGSTVQFARNHFDGVIQIGPLTCMPEIVAQTILQRVSVEEAIPCMTMYFDEHAGAAGIQTRLEAFTDMLRRKKQVVGI